MSLLIMLSLFTKDTIAQPNQELGIENLIPSSPEASALGKYGEYPVSLYTGIPNISIPIWNIKTANLQLPINLSYHASGRKVEEVATNVGLGWTLNAGGVITRTVRHFADDMYGGYYSNPFTGNPNYLDLEYVKDVRLGTKDGEPDIFYFNFDGYSGSFYFNNESEINIVSKEDLKIEVFYDNNTFIGFLITTPKGNKYYFGDENFNNDEYIEETRHKTPSNPEPREYIASWFLRKIVSVNQTDTIIFIYDIYGSSGWAKSIGETIELSPQNLSVKNQVKHVNYTNTLNRKRISTIIFKNGHIEMEYQNTRSDISDSESLDEIIVYDKNNNLIKKTKLYYSYFKSHPQSSNTESELRLKLDSVQEVNSKNETKPPYSFTYYTEHNLPSRSPDELEFYKQDHWGFYNGAICYQKTLIPDFEYMGNSYISSDREPYWPYTKSNMLEEIHYPTGGHTEFIFEPNYVGMIGPDTVQGYFEDAQLSGDTLKCDNPAIMIIEAGSFEIHDDEHCAFRLTLGLDTLCDDNIGGKILATIHGGSYSKSYSLEYEPGNEGYIVNNFIDTLSVGNYSLTIGLYHQSLFWYSFNYEKYFDEQKIIQREYQPVGGIRIAKIINYPVFGDTVTKEYDYTYRDIQGEQQYSSAIITNIPNYSRYLIRVKEYLSDYPKWWFIMKGPSTPQYYAWDIIELSSHSNIPLGTTQGGIVGYSEVTEKQYKGETTYKYSNKIDYNDTKNYYFNTYVGAFQAFIPEENFSYPYPPKGNMDWARGKLLEKTIYDNNNDCILKEVSEYDVNYDSNLVIKVAPMYTYNNAPPPFDEYYNAIVFYKNISGWMRLAKTTTTHFINNSPGLQSQEIYENNGNGHLQMTEQTKTSSGGKTLKTTYTYPGDVSNPSIVHMSQHAIDTMLNWHMIGIPLKTEKYTNSNKVDGKITSYDFFNDTLLLPEKPRILTGDIYKIVANYDKYDSRGNPIQYHKEDNINVSYLWGYNYTYPIAVVENAEYEDVIGALSVTYSDLQTKNSAELKSIFQELIESSRVPEHILCNAMIHSYTYDPLVGKTSETDPNGKIITYHYDSFNRLETVRDHDNMVIKHYDYNYFEKIFNVTPNSFVLENSAGSGQVNITSNLDWKVMDNTIYWLSIEPPGEGSGDGSFSFSCIENIYPVDRTTEIVVTASGCPNKTITITQLAANYIAITPEPLEFNIPFSGNGSKTFTIDSNIQWTAENSGDQFFTFSPTSGTGNGTIFTIYGLGQEVTSTKEGWITISGSGINKVIHVIQVPHP